MTFLQGVLERPSYGYSRDGHLYVPSHRELFREFFSRLNLFRSRKNWIQFSCWFASCAFAVPFVIFFTQYFSWTLVSLGFCYSMIGLGTHGTIYYHRYCTHRAYRFSHPFWLFWVRNLVIKIIPEELYVVSHHVHHQIPERPGDPYNAHAGWWYCFLADAVHQPIEKTLSSADYNRVVSMLDHTGIHINRYDQYLKWGSVCHPYYTAAHFVLNWCFWYGVFYWIGGHALATALFASAGFWAFGVRTFNFAGHGGGVDKRKDGVDFNRSDLSINQLWPGLVTGEWHNNHHLFPSGARAGFLFYQVDYAWYFIRTLAFLGMVSSYRDDTQRFFEECYYPYLRSRNPQQSLESETH